MNPRRIMIGTAGHVDHGKTSLVHRLTGTHTDTLEEEKKRGLSINLGFAPCFLNDQLVAGLVDVPGHEKFIRNMIAGASGLDLVLLVVAADDSIMPQTREHLFILDRLGIKEGLIVINKIDLVDSETRELVKLELEELLQGSFLEKSKIVEVSATTGEGIDELKSSLANLAQNIPTKKTKGFFRLPIQRVFSKAGIGCIVTGIPFSGHVSKGENLEVFPQKKSCRLRGIQAYGQDADSAEAGHSVAFNLAGLDYREFNRGDVLCTPDLFELTSYLQVFYNPLPQARWPKNHSEVTVHLGTTTVNGHISWLEEKNELGLLTQLKLTQPTLTVPGDHFLVRDPSGKHTLGGGQIVSIQNNKLTRRQSDQIDSLKSLHKNLSNTQAQLLSRLWPHQLATVKDFEKHLFHPQEDFIDELSVLKSSGKIRLQDNFYFLPETPNTLVKNVVHTLEKYYQTHPQDRWIDISVLLDIYTEPIWKIISHAPSFTKSLKTSGQRICLSDRLVPLTKTQRQWADKLITELTSGSFTPPLPEDVFQGMPTNNKPQIILKALVDNQEILKLSDKVYWTHETFEKACEKIKELGQQHSTIEINHIKEAFGLSRKFAVPLLELTDKFGLTQRVENGRIVKM